MPIRDITPIVDRTYLLKSFEQMTHEYGIDVFGDILTPYKLDGRHGALLYQNRIATVLDVIHDNSAVYVKITDLSPSERLLNSCFYYFPIEILYHTID